MAQFTVYKSTDGSAPTLSGTADSLRQLLKACLVDGYGSQTAAGWAEAFTGTNKAAYRAASGNRLYFRLQDDAAGTGGAKEAQIRGFETMSDVDTGTGPFPADAQSSLTSNSLIARKSTTADATARVWIVVADALTCYVFIYTGDVASTYYSFGFGEFYSLLPSDAYRSMVIARAVENNTGQANENLDRIATNVTGTTAGHYFPRGYTTTGGSVLFGKHGDAVKSGSSTALLGTIPYTNPEDGGLYLSPLWIHDPTTAPANNLRGRMRGLWHFLHALTGTVANLDTVTGVGDLSGKTFLFLKQGGLSDIYTIETSNTLETN